MFEKRSPEFRSFIQSVYKNRAALEAGSRDIASIRNTMDAFVGYFPLPSSVRLDTVDCGGVPGEWINVDGVATDRVVLYLHGGCYISGSPGVVREFCGRLAVAAACRVLSIDYRLAPEHPFPAALDDTLHCYRWLLEQGHRPEQVAIAGESAGGGLTIALLLRCRELHIPLPACGVPISPWVDMEVSFGASLRTNRGIDLASVEPLEIGARAYAGNGHRRDPLASPLHADLRGLPPLLIQVGTSEVLRDEGVEIASRAQRAGCDVTLQQWEDMVHVWHWYGPLFPEAREATDAIGKYVTAHLC